jgi:hypothetical protein
LSSFVCLNIFYRCSYNWFLNLFLLWFLMLRRSFFIVFNLSISFFTWFCYYFSYWLFIYWNFLLLYWILLLIDLFIRVSFHSILTQYLQVFRIVGFLISSAYVS